MSTEFLTHDVWSKLTQAAGGARQRFAVAVAYFGIGASRMLPLSPGSRLVVDASERAVASGQTSPAELIKLVRRGVRVFSVPNLHAKVFVFGRSAYIGSTNVSSRSASHLVEAVVRTTHPHAVQTARQFVQELCVHELSPTVLKRLAKLYRPPIVPGGKRVKKGITGTSRRPTLPRLMLAQLSLLEWSESEQALHDAALSVAKKRRQHPRSYELESFQWTGRCPFQRGDVVVQVTNEGSGNVLVTAPGNVLHVRSRRDHNNRQISFVYLECPDRRRRQLKALSRTLGYGALKRLRRNGKVSDAAFAQELLNVWSK